MGTDYAGVLHELVAGCWQEPGTGKRYSVPLRDVQICATLDGAEAELVHRQHAGQRLVVVSDPRTHGALGARVLRALAAAGLNAHDHVWHDPICSEQGVEQLRHATRGHDALIAVGSGTINDSVKYASYLDKRAYSVFPTSPMTAYTTNTASVSFNGFKRSITCHGARGVFFDLSVLCDCPARLISAAFADVICRTTAQVDWLMSHLLRGTLYTDTPYTLLKADEPGLVSHADLILKGDLDVMARLARISALMGLGTIFTQTTHSGSMAEHLISHYIDMFAGNSHPGSSHGEQVGVATGTVSYLQNKVFRSPTPPHFKPTRIPVPELRERYGEDASASMIEQARAKALGAAAADDLNRRLETQWPVVCERLRPLMLPTETLLGAMRQAGCPTHATSLGLKADFYKNAVRHARFIRDRFSVLDVVDDTLGLDAMISDIPV